MIPTATEGQPSKLELIRKNWKDRIWWRDVYLFKVIFPLMSVRDLGPFVLEQGWNNLIILDACRFDVFERLIKTMNFHGKLFSHKSRATDTGEFFTNNFLKPYYDDVIYISANPFADKFIKNKVYKLISVWRTDWNEEADTVLPETMSTYTLEAVARYPDKRIISHFVQPHYPYIGHPELNVSKFESAHPEGLNSKSGGYKDTSIFTISAKLIFANSMKDKANHLRAYTDNLKLALESLQKIVEFLPGKTVFTADHGEAFGERISPVVPVKVYGHMPRMRINSLTNVPWYVLEADQKGSLK